MKSYSSNGVGAMTLKDGTSVRIVKNDSQIELEDTKVPSESLNTLSVCSKLLVLVLQRLGCKFDLKKLEDCVNSVSGSLFGRLSEKSVTVEDVWNALFLMNDINLRTIYQAHIHLKDETMITAEEKRFLFEKSIIVTTGTLPK